MIAHRIETAFAQQRRNRLALIIAVFQQQPAARFQILHGRRVFQRATAGEVARALCNLPPYPRAFKTVGTRPVRQSFTAHHRRPTERVNPSRPRVNPMRIGAPVLSQQDERRPVEGIVAERRITKFRIIIQEALELLFGFCQVVKFE